MTRKYWIGVSAPNSRAPSDFESHLVYNRAELEALIEYLQQYITNDFEDMEEHENEDGTDELDGV